MFSSVKPEFRALRVKKRARQKRNSTLCAHLQRVPFLCCLGIMFRYRVKVTGSSPAISNGPGMGFCAGRAFPK